MVESMSQGLKKYYAYLYQLALNYLEIYEIIKGV